MSILSRLSLLVFLICAASCASSPARLKPEIAAKLAGHTIACVRQQTEPFQCVTPSQALAGSAMVYVGAQDGIRSMMVAAGRKVADKVEDPGEKIEKALMNHFTERFGMKVGPTQIVPTESAYGNRPKRPATGTDYVLEIGPVATRAVYFPAAWLRYRIGAMAGVQLVDPRTETVLAKGLFGSMPTKYSDDVSHSDVMANTNGVVTRTVNEATQTLIERFKRDVFVR